MAKLAELGDLVQDKSQRLGTVIGSTTSSITIKHSHSKVRIQYSRLVSDIDFIGYKLVAKHKEVLSAF